MDKKQVADINRYIFIVPILKIILDDQHETVSRLLKFTLQHLIFWWNSTECQDQSNIYQYIVPWAIVYSFDPVLFLDI